MIKLKRKRIKEVLPNRDLHLGVSYFANIENDHCFLITKSNLFGKIMTILLAPYYILVEGISEYPNTVKYVFNFYVRELMSKEAYDKLVTID